MDSSRFDWARQELQCVATELHMLDEWPAPHNFFANELEAISELQDYLLKREQPTQEVQERVYWLAASLHGYDQPWCTLQGKIRTASAIAASVSSIMGGRRADWMAASPNWDV